TFRPSGIQLFSADNPYSRKTNGARLHVSPHKSRRTTRRATPLGRESPMPFERDAVPLCGSELSHQASAAVGAGAHWRLADCATESVFERLSPRAPFHSAERERDDARAKIDIIDTGSRSGLGQQARLCHTWN